MVITNFASGELSPAIAGRVDIPQYYQGASRLVNFDVIPTGGIARRAGTQRIANLPGDCRLIPFIIDRDRSFVLEVRPRRMLVWENGTRKTAGGAQVEVSVPWQSLSEIREVQYAQNYDTMIFTQQDHAPVMLTYSNGDGTFTCGEMSFDFSPDVELDDDYGWIPVMQSLPHSRTESGWCVQGGYLWKYSDGSGEWTKDDGTTEYEQDADLFTGTGKFPRACAFFNGRLFFASTRASRQKVWASASPDLSGTRYNDFSTYVKYVTVNKVVTDPDIHFFTADTAATAGDDGALSGDLMTLENVTQDLTGIAGLSGYYVTGDVVAVGTRVVAATWDASAGKGTVTLSAAVVGAGRALVFSVQKWKDRTTPSDGDYEYKVVNTNMTRADCSFFFEVASDQNDAVKWLASSGHLVIGTESGTYVMSAGSSATGQQVMLNGRHGTDEIQATVVDRAVIYFSQGLRGIREYYWNQQEESFTSNDIAMLAPEMLSESPAVDFDFMTNPYSRLIVTRDDGTLAVLLYEKGSGVMAWGRVELGSGLARSVAVTRGDGGCDIAYLLVEDRDGGFWLERLDMDAGVYLDGWSAFTGSTAGYGPDAVIVNDMTGEWVTADDWDSGNYPAGFIGSGDTAHIGWRYGSLMRSMPVVGSDPTGRKRIVKLLVRFHDSARPWLSIEGKDAEVFTDFDGYFTGIKEIGYPGKSERDVTFTLETDEPRRCAVLAVNAITD